MRLVTAALIMLAVAAPLAHGQESEVAVPRLTPVGEVHIDVPGDEASMLTASSPDGRYLAVCFAPRSDDSRRADSWTALRIVDTRTAKVTGAWDDLDMGPLPPAFSPDGRLVAFGTRKDATTLTVHVRACATAAGVTQDVEHAAGSLGFAEVCGVSGNAQRVAIREPAGADGMRHLVIYELTKRRQIARYAGFREPYAAGRQGRVVLTGPLVAFHTATADESSPVRHRLHVIELDTSRVCAETSAFAARTTSRFALTPDGGALVNGTADFDVERIDLATGARTILIDGDDLSSHYLEVVLSTDGKRVVAWSDERKLLLVRDLDGDEQRRVELDSRAHVLGISADGSWAYVRDALRGLVAWNLDVGAAAGTVTTEPADWMRMTADGAHLLSRVRDDTGWTIRIEAVETP